MKQRMGDLLVNAGLIDEATLKTALATAAREGRRLGDVLVAEGYCEEQDILKALARQHNAPIVGPARLSQIDPEVLRLIPRDFAEERQVLPLGLFDGLLEVAVADPSAFDLVDELRFVTGHPIKALAAAVVTLQRAIETAYGQVPSEVTPPPDSPEATSRVRTLERQIRQLDARVEELTRRLDDAAAAHHALTDALEAAGVLHPHKADREG